MRSQIRGLFVIAASALLMLPAVTLKAAEPIDVRVMTQNLYLGADTTSILMATTLPKLVDAINAAAASVVANNFPARATAIANEIASAGGPLLVGLQESEIVSNGKQSLNYADVLIAALETQGLHYTYKVPGIGDAVHKGFTLDSTAFGIPGIPPFTLVDQEVVLVRADVRNFTVTSISAPTFANDATVVSPLFGQFSLKRGYVLVEASLDGVLFQFVSTHLVETHDALEPAEVAEILTALGTTNEAGLGSTCCQSPTLDNPVSSLSKRFDYIFERDFHAIYSAALVGDQRFEDVRPLWPSDHAGVVATIAEVVGTPGFSNCHGLSIAALSHQFGNLGAAAKALGFSDVTELQDAVRAFCRL